MTEFYLLLKFFLYVNNKAALSEPLKHNIVSNVTDSVLVYIIDFAQFNINTYKLS